MADRERPRFNRGERTNARTEDGPRPPKAGGAERRQRGRKEPQVRYVQEKPAFTFETPFSPEHEPELYAAHKQAAEILHKARPQIPRIEVHDDAPPEVKNGIVDRQKKYEHHRAEDERLTYAFAYQAEQKTPEVRAKERRSHAFSELLEAMLLTGGTQLFGKGAVVLPAQFSDRKDATDLVVQLDGGVGLAIDAATEQDVAGYDGPAWASGIGEKKKGVREKMMRSYRQIASGYGNLTRVQYAAVGNRVRDIENMPRVVVGLSQAAVARIAPAWAANPQTFNFAASEEFRQIQRSVARQLVAQTQVAREEEQRAKKRHGAPLSEQEKEVSKDTATPKQTQELFWHTEREHLDKTMAALRAAVPHKGGKEDEVLDPVIAAIDGTTKNRTIREEIIAAAKKEQAAFHEQQGFIQTERNNVPPHMLPEDADLTPRELAFLDEHIRERVNPAQREALIQALAAFRANPTLGFPVALLGAAAGGVPVRLWKRLKSAAEPRVESLEPKNTEAAPVQADAARDTHTAVHDVHTAAHEVPPMPTASAAMHLGAIGAAGAGLAAAHVGGRFEKRGSRWWSRMKNAVLHAATTGAAYAAGLSAKWLLCGLGAGVGGMLLGGAAAGMGVGFGLWKYWKKKGYYDDVMERERAAARAKIEHMHKTHPLYYRRVTANEAAYTAEVEKIATKYWRYNTAVLGLANVAASTTLLQWQTGGKFLPTLGSDVAAGNWKLGNTLALFACTTPAWGSGKSAAAVAAVPGGRGGAAGAMGAVPPSGKGGAAALPPGGRGSGFNPLTDAAAQKRSGFVAKDPWAPQNRHDPHNPWASWQKRQIPTEFMPQRSRGVAAPFQTHMGCCHEQLYPLQTRRDFIITDQGGGRWRAGDTVRSYTWGRGAR